MPTWLITGCSTGFGRQLAEAVLARGGNAVVTARDPQTVQDLAASYPETALALALDVTEHAQVTAAVAAADERFGGVDVLVNNAGYGYRAAVEEAEDEGVRKLFDTNFFGLVDVTKAVLPGMRARRSGTIVNLSSVAGRVPPAGSGYYAATKFAVEAVSDALRKELEPLGIRVIVVEPGGFRTDFAGRSLHQSREAIADYAGTAGLRRKENSSEHGHQPGDPAKAVAAMIAAAESPHPPFRLVLGRDSYERISAELAEQLRELEAGKPVAFGTDFED